jgi:hypothetical protein
MSEPKRNPDGTVAIPEAPKLRNGHQYIFFYKDNRANATEAFTVQVVTVFPEDGDTVTESRADGSMLISVNTPRKAQLTIRRTWDYLTEMDVKVPERQI